MASNPPAPSTPPAPAAVARARPRLRLWARGVTPLRERGVRRRRRSPERHHATTPILVVGSQPRIHSVRLLEEDGFLQKLTQDAELQGLANTGRNKSPNT